MGNAAPRTKETAVEPLRFKGISKAAREMLAAEGESERFEFKRDVAAVKPRVLVAAANWVALDPSARDKVTLLVGVDEQKNPDSGLVTGKIVGLADLEKSVDAIQQFCSKTYPVPVGLPIIEEGVETSTPFLRLEIWPEHPPHYDSEGRRVVRLNASTRPLTDQEMLDIYLDREAVQFDRRFRETAAHLHDSLLEVLGNVDDVAERVTDVVQDLEASINDQVHRLEDAAWQAANEAEESKSVAENVQYDMQTMLDRLPLTAFWDLRQKRVFVWSKFALDAVARPTKATETVQAELRYWLERPIDPNNWLMNQTELEFWMDALARREDKGRMSFWMDRIAARSELAPQGFARLHDEVAELAAERKRVMAMPPHRSTAKK